MTRATPVGYFGCRHSKCLSRDLSAFAAGSGLTLDKPSVAGAWTPPSTPDEVYELVSVLGSAGPVRGAGEFGTARGIAHTIPIYEGLSTPRRQPVPWVQS